MRISEIFQSGSYGSGYDDHDYWYYKKHYHHDKYDYKKYDYKKHYRHDKYDHHKDYDC